MAALGRFAQQNVRSWSTGTIVWQWDNCDWYPGWQNIVMSWTEHT